jgi:hypothetical protein
LNVEVDQTGQQIRIIDIGRPVVAPALRCSGRVVSLKVTAQIPLELRAETRGVRGANAERS